MRPDPFDLIQQEIMAHESNASHTVNGFAPLFVASRQAKIMIVGQAPGIKAQQSGMAWNDASGERLREWLGVTESQFRDPLLFAHVPMDFYYPGKGKSGDLPPRKDFAPLWHARLRELMPEIELTVLVGAYAQKYYLSHVHPTLTETVRNYEQYLPEHLPIVHPSPLNFRWFAKNPWFERDLVPVMQGIVAKLLES